MLITICSRCKKNPCDGDEICSICKIEELETDLTEAKKAIVDHTPATMMLCPVCEKYYVRPRKAKEGCIRCQLTASQEEVKGLRGELKKIAIDAPTESISRFACKLQRIAEEALQSDQGT
jgi:hypothetical protein